MDKGALCYQRYLSGDNSGLDELVEMYNNSLIFYINGFANNIAVSEDIAADTFVELIVRKNHFKNDYMFKTWLYKIARNNVIDYLRKQSKRQSVPIEDLENELSDNEVLERTILKNEQNKQLHKTMKNMHDDYRDVLHLVCFEDMSYEGASTVLGKNIKQIKNLVYRAKQALKLELEREGFVYEDI
ncbi:MAG: RNA polymerase sigma factor [Defluviitaleaceae bacterium]|nr:RNA polymerase sigma factor [Defluviitaleaceae bacterium]